MPMPKRDLLTIAFLVLALSGSALTVMGTVNYLKFYPTLTRLELTLISFQWNSTEQSLSIQTSFLIKNPADYNGLILRRFQGDFSIELPQNVTIDQGGMPFKPVEGPLNPGNTITASFRFNSTAQAARQAWETVQNGGRVGFLFQVDLVLTTFLEDFTGISAFYLCETSTDPVPCEQQYIQVQTRISQGGGGGGGGA